MLDSFTSGVDYNFQSEGEEEHFVNSIMRLKRS